MFFNCLVECYRQIGLFQTLRGFSRLGLIFLVTSVAFPRQTEALPAGQSTSFHRRVAQAPDGTLIPTTNTQAMSLLQTLRVMLEQNPTLAKERLTIQQAQQEWIGSLGSFAFDLQLDFKLNGANLPADSQIDPQLLNLIQGNLSLQSLSLEGSILLTKRFEIGTYLTVRFQNWWSQQDSIDFNLLGGNQESKTLLLYRMTGALTFQVTQPLLKGAWLPVNLAPIYQAAAQVKIVRQQVAVMAAEYVQQTVHAYWDLVYARQNVTIQQQALKLAQAQLTQTMGLIKAGKMASIEQYQVQQVEAARKADLLLAQEQELTAQTQLRVLLNLQTNVSIDPTDQQPTLSELPPLLKLLKLAQEHHPQVLIARHQQEVARWSVVSAKNGVLPQLDLTGSFTFAGSGRTFPPRNGQTNTTQLSPLARTYETLFDPRYHQFYVGISLKIPLDNRKATSHLASRELELQRSQIQIQLLQRQFILQVSQLHTQATRNKQRLSITEISVLLAQKKLEAEQNKLDVGQSTLFQVLQFQQDLATAKLARLRAFVDYHKTLASLIHATGNILEEYGVVAKK